MAKEVYRIEIPIETTDNYSEGLKKAEKGVKDLEDTTKKAGKSAEVFGNSSEKAASSVEKVGSSARKSEGDVTKFQGAVQKTRTRLKELTSSKWQLTIHAVDRASRVISNVGSFARRVVGGSYRFTIRAVDMVTRPLRGIFSTLTSLLSTPLAWAGIAGGVGIGALIKDLIDTSGRTETLDIAMKSVAKSTSTSMDELKKQKEAVMDLGIAEQEAMQVMTRFMQSNLDVSQASKIARVAQDAAVIAGMNSSEATEQMVESIAKLRPELLSAFGMTRGLNDIYADHAETLGITAYSTDKYGKRVRHLRREMNDTEKKQAVMNYILSEGTKITGTYEASMGAAAKKMGSLKRYYDTLKNAVGKPLLLPAFGVFIDGMTGAFKRGIKWAGANEEKLQKWGKRIAEIGGVASKNFGRWFGKMTEKATDVSKKVGTKFGDLRKLFLPTKEELSQMGELEKYLPSDLAAKLPKNLSFSAKVGLVIDEANNAFSNWWENTGRAQVTGVSGKMGTAFGEMVNGAILGALGISSEGGSPFVSAGFEAGSSFVTGFLNGLDAGEIALAIGSKLKDVNVDAGKSAWGHLTGDEELAKQGSVGGAIAVDLLAIAGITKALSVLKGPKNIGKWILGTLGRKSKGVKKPTVVTPDTKPSSGKSNTPVMVADTTPSKPAPVILDQYGKPLPPSGSAPKSAPVPVPTVAPIPKTSKLPKFLNPKEWKLPELEMPKLPKGVSSIFKKIPILGSLFSLATIAGSTKEEMPGAIGAVGGGLAGAKVGAIGGAAIGSIVPGVGTAIGAGVGGILGGIGGAISGEKVMSWLFGPKKASAAEMPNGTIDSNGNMKSMNESSLVVAAATTALAEKAQVTTQNIEALNMVLGESSGWVVGAFNPLVEEGARIQANAGILTGYLGEASGWIANLYGVESGATAVKSALSNLVSRINNVILPNVSSSSSGGSPKAYADGGYINSPHLGLVGEAGPEMIIPLSSGRRNRAMDLYQRTGALLGIKPYANGGMVGVEPMVSMPDSAPVTAVSSNSSSINANFSIPVSFSVDNSDNDKESIIQQVINEFGSAVIPQLREALSNMP